MPSTYSNDLSIKPIAMIAPSNIDVLKANIAYISNFTLATVSTTNLSTPVLATSNVTCKKFTFNT